MTLVLNGGGEGKTVANARTEINRAIDHNKKILYIPFAWVEDDTYNSCLEFMRNELSDIQCNGIDMVKNGQELFNKRFEDYAFLYIGGGNTYKLLNELKNSGNFEKIKDYLLNKNGIIYGGSAGAIIFGKDLDSCNTDDDNYIGLQDNRGFDVLKGYSLLCHFTNREKEKTELSKKYLLELSKEKPVYAIPEEDSIIVTENDIKFIGTKPYYIFENGKMREVKIENRGSNR